MEDYKQKYEEALERAKKYYNRELYAECNGSLVEDIFPELCESEDEKIKEDVISLVNEFWERIGSINPEYSSRSEMLNWLEKQGEKKPAFCHHEVDLSDCSEEYRKAYYDGWNNCNQQHAQLEAEQKPAWSENDERLKQRLIKDQEKCLEEVKNDKVGHSEIISDLKEMYRERIDWLKSLKERYTWKPNDKQMKAIGHICDGNYNVDLDILDSIYRDFKKLREE